MRDAIIAALTVVALAGGPLLACVVPTPKPGSCECVCAWRRPSEESGRLFRLRIVDADGGVLR